MLSHRNMVAGAASVAGYLGMTPADRLLAVLPLSFDYGLSQLTTAFLRGAPRGADQLPVPARYRQGRARAKRITGLAAVPPLWIQLAQLAWPADCSAALPHQFGRRDAAARRSTALRAGAADTAICS